MNKSVQLLLLTLASGISTARADYDYSYYIETGDETAVVAIAEDGAEAQATAKNNGGLKPRHFKQGPSKGESNAVVPCYKGTAQDVRAILQNICNSTSDKSWQLLDSDFTVEQSASGGPIVHAKLTPNPNAPEVKKGAVLIDLVRCASLR